MMSEKRQIEIFSAGCPACNEVIDLVNRMACASCEISVLDMHDRQVAKRAAKLGIKSVPAVAINGQLADCCANRGVDENVLRAAGISRD